MIRARLQWEYFKQIRRRSSMVLPWDTDRSRRRKGVKAQSEKV